jgi:hypothetical protein
MQGEGGKGVEGDQKEAVERDGAGSGLDLTVR